MQLVLLSGLGHAVLVALGLLIYVLATRITHQQRHPSAALGWVLGMVTLPYLTLPLFLLFGTRKFARPERRAHEAPPSLPPNAAWAAPLLACMGMAPAARHDAIALHADGAEALAGLRALMEGARGQLDVCTYVLGSDALARELVALLCARARAGVQVRLLIDALGSLRTPRALLRELEGAGAEVRHFMPLWHNPLRGRTNLRNHRKTVVADGVRLWSGGRNLAGEYFVGTPERPAWIDLSFEVTGPVAAQAHAQFNTDWRLARGLLLHRMRRAAAVPVHEPAAGPLAQWLPSGPDHADDTLHALLLAGAFHARTRICAVTPYFVPDDALLDAWCLACRRGVALTLVVPARSNHRLADIARARALRQLAAAGAHIWLVPAMVHAKAVLIDDALGLVGSLNLDARSLFLNYEAMTAFYDPAQIAWLAHWCHALQRRAERYHARPPSWPRDILEGVVRALGFQL